MDDRVLLNTIIPGRRVAHRHQLKWWQPSDYEIRVLKVFNRLRDSRQHRIVWGEKNGQVAFLDHLAFGDRKPLRRRLETQVGRPGPAGPVYALAFVHPPQAGDVLLNTTWQLLVAAGTGCGELQFLDYLTGNPISIIYEGRPVEALQLDSCVLSLLYVEATGELWVGLASGQLMCLQFQFQATGASARTVATIPLEAAVSALAFMPFAEGGAGHRSCAGWICAGTMIGTLYRIDPEKLSLPITPIATPKPIGPVRALYSLSSALAAYASPCEVLVVAHAGKVRYMVREPALAAGEAGDFAALEHAFADRVMCLGCLDFGESVWLAVGANDSHLHLLCVFRKEAGDRPVNPVDAWTLLNQFGCLQCSIPMSERVLAVAAMSSKCSPGKSSEADPWIFAALGNHRLQALQILRLPIFVERVRSVFKDSSDVPALLRRLRDQPDDRVLRHDTIALLFRTDWLDEYCRGRTWSAEERRQLSEILYRLLAGSSLRLCREIQSGLIRIAQRHQSFARIAADLVRHISKYCLDGRSFSDKHQHLDRLARFNEDNGGEYLIDAALYRSLLADRRFTQQHAIDLGEPVTTLQLLSGPNREHLLATSYQQGLAWLMHCDESMRAFVLEVPEEGSRLGWLQQVVPWQDAASGARHLIVFYRNRGWTSISLADPRLQEIVGWAGDGRKAAPVGLPMPNLVAGCDGEPFYIYSFQQLPSGQLAVGGRSADVRLLRISSAAGHSSIELACGPPRRPGDQLSSQYSPIRAFAYHPTSAHAGEVFAGSENGSCYRFELRGAELGPAAAVWQGPAAIRVLLWLDPDSLLIGDANSSLVLLQRLSGTPRSSTGGTGARASTFAPTWAGRLNGAVTGALPLTLRLPTAGPDLELRDVVVASDAKGVLHILEFDGPRGAPRHITQHRFAIDTPWPIEQLVAAPRLPPDMKSWGQPQVAIASVDQVVRTLRLVHRRESVRDLNNDLALAAAAALASSRSRFPPRAVRATEDALRGEMDRDSPLPVVLAKVTAARRANWPLTDGDVKEALAEVAWKLASANVQSEAPGMLALRLRFDDPETWPRLIDHLFDLAAGRVLTQAGGRPMLQLHYCLRFAFKNAKLVAAEELLPEQRQQLARLVHVCHDLCQNWGSESSDENLRCKLTISHMLFRFATPETLECFLSETLSAELAEISGRSMADFVANRLLADPRLAVTFRVLQHIRRLVEHDLDGRMATPVGRYLVPPLVARFRRCQITPYHDWVAGELYLCLRALQVAYRCGWAFVAQLLATGCPRGHIEFLAERQRILPLDDELCRRTVEALSRVVGISASDPHAHDARRGLLEQLAGIDSLAQREEAPVDVPLCIRALIAVSIAFDPGAGDEPRTQAQQVIALPLDYGALRTPAASGAEIAHLLAAARLLLLVTTAEPGADSLRPIYRQLEELRHALLARGPVSGSGDDDLLGILFRAAREAWLRQAEIELDFVAPMRFLRERRLAEQPAADEASHARELLDYAAFHAELSSSRHSLFLRRDTSGKGVICTLLGQPAEIQGFTKPVKLERYLDIVLRPWEAKIGRLQREAARLLNAAPVTDDTARRDLLGLDDSYSGELIPISRDDQRYGLFFFVYDTASAPDPSKRALSRMVPQLLASEFLRSGQTQKLLSLIFHHISSPIASMRNMLVPMLEGRLGPDEREDYLRFFSGIVEDAKLMIDNHENYARILRGIAPPLVPETFDLAVEAGLRRRVILHKYHGKRQALPWRPPAAPLEVRLDRVMVGDIIQNLLDNACKYSPARSEVRLKVTSARREVFIVVSDEGPGLPRDIVDSLYAEGVRGEAGADSTTAGLGLGLFMVHRYALWLNGQVWHETSERGTTFTVRLPKEARR
ncbi:MAG TPA: HAMP domain-containing sensor histidine kinase [Thermoanaerobaculia bacterium]|nr:HAMP domain-containing sensor histidine kinase [Thermoanaerobaculia bacterium]